MERATSMGRLNQPRPHCPMMHRAVFAIHWPRIVLFGVIKFINDIVSVTVAENTPGALSPIIVSADDDDDNSETFQFSILSCAVATSGSRTGSQRTQRETWPRVVTSTSQRERG